MSENKEKQYQPRFKEGDTILFKSYGGAVNLSCIHMNNVRRVVIGDKFAAYLLEDSMNSQAWYDAEEIDQSSILIGG